MTTENFNYDNYHHVIDLIKQYIYVNAIFLACCFQTLFLHIHFKHALEIRIFYGIYTCKKKIRFTGTC